jgi:16S rRNA (cytosine967-C5)-methyltransferase
LALEGPIKVEDTFLTSDAWKRLSPPDQALGRELVYGTTRMRLLLDHHLATSCDRPLLKLASPVRTALRMGLYQMLFLDRVPVHAAVHESVTLVKRSDPGSTGFANAVLRRLAERRPLPSPEGVDEAGTLSIVHSHPLWMVERWLARLGPGDAREVLEADNRAHPLTMRVAPGLREQVLAALTREGWAVEPLEWPADSFVLSGRGAGLFESESFLRGDWIVQDWTPQAMMELVPAVPGARVWDVCAAPGGKSVGLSWRVGPSGAVLASDVSPLRTRRLRENLRRVGASNVRVHEGDVRRLPGSEKYDVVWLDAPCTGTGVLSRRADLRWRLSPEDVGRHAAQQAALLEEVHRRVYPGGCLVYSTCSLEDEENDAVVGAFLAAHPGFRARTPSLPGSFPGARPRPSGLLILPTSRHDGGYVAVLERTAT